MSGVTYIEHDEPVRPLVVQAAWQQLACDLAADLFAAREALWEVANRLDEGEWTPEQAASRARGCGAEASEAWDQAHIVMATLRRSVGEEIPAW